MESVSMRLVVLVLLSLFWLRPRTLVGATDPTGQPTRQPTRQPTGQPTRQPTGQPSSQPTRQPTGQPSRQPTQQPTGQPTRQPTGQPTRRPTGQPSRRPSSRPSGQPSTSPSSAPTHKICFGCSSGQYFETNLTRFDVMLGCTACKPGYTCAGGCVSPVACSAGKFAADYGSTSCSSCPVGKYNHMRASMGCETCAGGYECQNSTSTPRLCTAGRYSPVGSTACFDCPGGSYGATSGLSVCSPCVPGNYCPQGTTQPQPCSPGRYAVSSAGNCTFCGAGYYCPSTQASNVIACPNGYYSLGGTTACTESPQGYYLPAANQPPVICPAGKWSTEGATECTSASSGSYVSLPGSAAQTQCAQGYWSNGGGATSCSRCDPGYYCDAGSTSATPAGAACTLGYYCPSSTVRVLCPAGKYGTLTAGKSDTEACTLCPEGYYCNGNTGLVSSDKHPCGSGTYCAAGAPSPEFCPPGTYSWRTMQTSIATCEICSRGYFCGGGASAQNTCPQNYYCPVATGDYNDFPCPPGTYGGSTGLYSASQCSNCTAGHYCAGGADPVPCPVGTYNAYMAGSTIFSCAACTAGFACPNTGMYTVPDSTYRCPQGYYCPSGTQSLTQFSCAAGSYSDSFQLTGQSGCTACPAGYTCAAASTTAAWVICPAGYYCPSGTAAGSAQPCPAGKFSASTGLSDSSQCVSCPAGSYCLAAASAVTGACAAGYYCPSESTSNKANPCPSGKYSSSTTLTTSSACTTTSAGYYTEAGAAAMTACPSGRYSAVTGTIAAAEGGSTPYCQACWAGSYCPAASSTPSSCGRGFYSDALASSCVICPRGTYCSSNTTTAAVLTTGGGSWSKSTDLSGSCFPGTICGLGEKKIPSLSTHACAAGYYCPAGSLFPTPCPAGRYNPLTGKGYLANCTITEAGFYSASASTAYTGLCSPGYYCPAGSNTPQQTPCPAGTYSPELGSESLNKCSSCPAGSYCPIAANSPLSCPRGYYCPVSTSEPAPCRPGSYGATFGLRASSECTPCDGGSYCDGYGLQNPRGLCSPGYFCISAANSSTPLDSNTTHAGALVTGTNVHYGRCPRGAYCPMGTMLPILCPQGTYNGHEGGQSLNDCESCPPGQYCQGLGNLAPTGLCATGYFCPGASSSPTQNQTQAGYFSLAGAMHPLACSAGKYNSLVAQSACTACVAGYYCPDDAMSTYTANPCPLGQYCPSGSIVPIDCSPGKYSFSLGLTNSTGCRACEPGSYCSSSGLTAVSGPCDSQYYCTSGATSRIQTLTSSTGGPCTTGHYCPVSTPAPIPCPVGTFMNSVLNAGSITYGGKTFPCTPCGAGRVCTTTGLTADNGACGAGYWCSYGASQTAASCTDATCVDMYGICPVGHYCPAGSPAPVQCNAGTYQPNQGQASCITCPAGQQCAAGASSYSPCDASRYCPEGSSPPGTYCPAGTYSLATGLSSSTQCLPCPATSYCQNGQVVGDCAAGYFCRTGQATPSPDVDDSGHKSTALANVAFLLSKSGAQCPAGHYCPQGTSEPVPCRNGTHRADSRGMSQDDCGPCPVGATCLTSSPVAEFCAKGRYCPNSGSQLECPVGTYNEYTGMGFLSDCLDCPAGHYCLGTGIANYSVYPCPLGKYCPAGTGRSSTEPIKCPEGTYQPTNSAASISDCLRCNTTHSHLLDERLHAHYCPAGSIVPIICPAGYYCWGTGQGFPCPPGSYCPFNSTAPTPCPETYFCQGNATAPVACVVGTYCPASAASPTACPLGYKGVVAADSSRQHLYSLATACVLCPAGKYGTDVSRLECDVGTPGYVFPVPGASSSHPLTLANGGGYVCPAGYYCPPGTTAEMACPVGTYQPETGKSNFSACLSCQPGTYQYLPASLTCLGCSASSASLLRSTLCTCIGLNRAFQANDGMCICKPGYEFVDASLVVSSEKDGSYDCQPIVYARCSSGTIRDSTGKCVSEGAYCQQFCGPSGGAVNPSTGTCDCTELPTVAEICDTACRASKPVISCVGGIVSVFDPVTSTTHTATPASLAADGVGAIDCSVEGSQILAMSTDSGSFQGVFGAPPALARRSLLRRERKLAKLDQLTGDSLGRDSSFDSALMQDNNNTSISTSTNINTNTKESTTQGNPVSRSLVSDPVISNPIVCMKAGDSIVFSVSNTNYPIYQKDSLLNTNPNFDYSDFRDLATQAASSATVSTFPFTFKEVGTYAFKMGGSSSIAVISVVPLTISCSSDSSFSELSTSNLAKLGIKTSTNFVLSPQWELLVGLLLGMLCLAVLVASFLYYFRKRAWDWHTPLDIKYRKKHKALGVPSETKGGIWSKGHPSWPDWGGKKTTAGFEGEGEDRRRVKVKPKNGVKQSWWSWLCRGTQAVASERDMDMYDDELHGEHEKHEEDLDTAVVAKNTAETEFEDDMLIPELAKHMSAQHDRINKQLSGQKDMMNKLKNVFRKEVDDLKALLESTALEMNAAGGTDIARARKLRELLKEVRENTVKRSLFEGSLQTGELALKSIGDKIRSVLESSSVEGLVEAMSLELSTSVNQAHARDEPIRTLISPVLHNLLSLTDSFCRLVGTQSQSILTEQRRREIANAAFDRSLKISHVMFPDSIFDLMQSCDETVVESDACVDDIMSITKAFGDRIPEFTTVVRKCEADICGILGDICEQSINAQLAKDQAEKTAQVVGFLTEFYDAVNLVIKELAQRRENAVFARDQGKLLRDDLIAAIDNELAMLTEATAAAAAAAAAQNLLVAGYPGPAGSGGADGGASSGSFLNASARGDSGGQERTAESADLEQAVINNDELTIVQKQEMLDSTETDRLVTVNMIAAHRKAIEQEQMLTTGQRDSSKNVESESALQSRNQAQQEALNESLRKSRDSKLEAMMRVEFFASLPQDSPHDVCVATIAVNRYAVQMRCHSLEARSAYEALKLEYERKVLSARQKLVVSSSSSQAAKEAINLDTQALDEALEKDLAALSQRLDAEKSRAVAAEDASRSGWQSNPAAVNVEAEKLRLGREWESRLAALRKASSEEATKRRTLCEDEAKIKREIFSVTRAQYGEDDAQEIASLLEKESAALLAVAEAKASEDSRTFEAECSALQELVALCDSWGPQVNFASLQSQLFLRVLAGLRATGDSRLRLALTEHQLRSEIQQVRTESDLRKRCAARGEIEFTLKNLSDSSAEKAAAMASNMLAATEKLVAEEQQRQDLSIVDYERERAFATENSAKARLQLTIEISRMRQAMHRSFREVLDVKADMLRELEVAPTLRQLNERQMQCEVMREELELSASYSAFDLETRVNSAYADESVQGAHPSVAWAQRVVSGALALELRVLTEALASDKLHKRVSREFMSGILRNLEEQRLMKLGRPMTDLTKIYADLEAQLAEQNRSVDSSSLREKQQLHRLLQGQAEEKAKAHSELEETATLVSRDESNERRQLQAALDSDMAPLMAQERTAVEGQKLLLAQRHAASLADLKLKSQGRLFAAYSECLGRLRMIYRLEDELRLRRNEAQQTSEALDNAAESESMNAYFAMMENQLGRQRVAKKLHDDYDLELNGLENVMAAKGDKAKRDLKARLDARNKAREAELVRSGLSVEAAKTQATKEASQDQASVMQASREEYQNEKKALQEALKAEVTAQATALKTEYRQAQFASEQGLAALEAREREVLEARLKARREARLKELQGPPSNKTLAVAKKMVERELKDSDESERGVLRSTLDHSSANLQQAIGQLYDSLGRELQEGYSAEQARVKADSTLTGADKQSRAQALAAALAVELEALKEQQRHSLGILEVGAEAEHQREKDALLKRLAARRQDRVDHLMESEGRTEKEATGLVDAEDKQALGALEASIRNSLRANQLASKESFESKRLQIMTQHEAKLHGLEASFAYQKQQGQSSLAERLAKRKELREKMVLATNLNAAQSASLLEGELSLVEQQALEALQRDTSDDALAAAKDRTLAALSRASQGLARDAAELRDLENDETSKFLADRQAKQASVLESSERGNAQMLERLQRDALAALKSANENEEMRRVRKEHEAAKSDLAGRFAAKKTKADADLQQRLAARRGARAQELVKQGLSTEAAASAVIAEESDMRVEAERALRQEEEAEAATLAKAAAEAERSLLEKQRESLSLEAKTTSEGTAAAARQLESLKAMQEAEFKRLLAQQRQDRETNDRALKARLAQKKDARLKLLAQKQASEQEMGAALAELAEQQHAETVESERERAEAEQRRVESLRKEHEGALAALEAEAQRLEMEASLAASKSAMLATMQENQQRSEAELAAKEAKRLRDAEMVESQRREEEHSRAQDQQKGKLADRLRAKRDKKELELKAQEERALAELATRQKSEAEERERARDARSSWMAALDQAVAKADSQGLTGALREEELLHSVLGGAGPGDSPKVPASQYGDVVERILSGRHAEEFATLVQQLGSDRISALQAAVEALAADKAKARMALVEQLNALDPPSSPQQVDAAIRELDEDFSRRQLAEESRVGDALDPKDLKAKMDLKEKQMSEVSRMARLWATEMAAGAGGTGGPGGAGGAGGATAEQRKSPAQELAEYRAALEVQKEQRKEALLRQRQEEEEALRREGEVKKKAMQEALEADLRRAEEEGEAQRRQLEATLKRQKDEVDRKNTEDMSEENKLEAERKKAEFEREHAAALEKLESDKSKGKARLQDRLNKRRAAVSGPAGGFEGLAAGDAAGAGAGAGAGGEEEFASMAIATAAASSASSSAPLPLGPTETRQQQQQQQQQQKQKRAPGEARQDPAALRALSNSMSAMQQKLERLEQLLVGLDGDKLAGAGAGAGGGGRAAGGQGGALSTYQDQDEPSPGTELVPIRPEELHVVEKSRLEFAQRLASVLGLSRLVIKAAASLPSPAAGSAPSGNAYQRSYLYAHAENTLYVHLKRLERSGDVGTVMVHALSHIKANPHDLSNDNDPTFLAIFYRSLGALSQETFKLASAGSTGSTASTASVFAESAGGGATMSGGGGGGGGGVIRAASGLGTRTSPLSSAKRGAGSLERQGSALGGRPGPGQLERQNTGLQSSKLLRQPSASGPGSGAGMGSRSGSGLPSDAGVASSGADLGQAGSAEFYSEQGILERMRTYAASAAGSAIPQDFIDRYKDSRRL